MLFQGLIAVFWLGIETFAAPPAPEGKIPIARSSAGGCAPLPPQQDGQGWGNNSLEFMKITPGILLCWKLDVEKVRGCPCPARHTQGSSHNSLGLEGTLELIPGAVQPLPRAGTFPPCQVYPSPIRPTIPRVFQKFLECGWNCATKSHKSSYFPMESPGRNLRENKA